MSTKARFEQYTLESSPLKVRLMAKHTGQPVVTFKGSYYVVYGNKVVAFKNRATADFYIKNEHIKPYVYEDTLWDLSVPNVPSLNTFKQFKQSVQLEELVIYINNGLMLIIGGRAVFILGNEHLFLAGISFPTVKFEYGGSMVERKLNKGAILKAMYLAEQGKEWLEYLLNR